MARVTITVIVSFYCVTCLRFEIASSRNTKKSETLMLQMAMFQGVFFVVQYFLLFSFLLSTVRTKEHNLRRRTNGGKDSKTKFTP